MEFELAGLALKSGRLLRCGMQNAEADDAGFGILESFQILLPETDRFDQRDTMIEQKHRN